MSGASIAAEVAAALNDVAGEVGDGSFAVTLVRSTGGETPWDRLNATEQTFQLPAAVFEYKHSQIDGTIIRMGDRRVMVGAEGERPTTADLMRIGETDYSIIKIEEFAPSGVPLYYQCQVRV